MKATKRNLLIALTGLGLASAPCHALTIVLNQVPVGSAFPAIGSTNLGISRAANTAILHPSTANVAAVIRSAADYWQTIYTFSTADVLTIDWGFCDAAKLNPTTATAGSYWTMLQSGGSGNQIIKRGTIGINVTRDFYVDSAPTTWSEYGSPITSTNIPYFNRPGQSVETERHTPFVGSGNNSFSDLFTSVLHEMGHLLGMQSSAPRYVNEAGDGDIDVTAPRPCPALSWMSSGGHLTFSGQPFSLMAPVVQTGYRKWPSQADISCEAQIEGWFVGSWGAGGGGVQGLAANNPTN